MNRNNTIIENALGVINKHNDTDSKLYADMHKTLQTEKPSLKSVKLFVMESMAKLFGPDSIRRKSVYDVILYTIASIIQRSVGLYNLSIMECACIYFRVREMDTLIDGKSYNTWFTYKYL